VNETAASEEAPASAKAAALLQRVGPQTALQLVKLLSPGELERLAAAFVAVARLDRSRRRHLLDLAVRGFREGGDGDQDPIAFARQVFAAHLGAESAEELLRSRRAELPAPDSLEWVPDSAAEVLAQRLEHESAGIVGVVLGALRPGVAAHVMSLLPGEAAGAALLWIAQGHSPMPEASSSILRTVAAWVEGDRLAALPSAARATNRHGPGRVVEILRQCDRATERAALDHLREHAPDIAERVSQSIFSTIEDIKWLDGRALQIVLREVESSVLARALRGASADVQRLCFDNLSENAAAALKEEIEILGPTPRKEVEAARQQILNTIRKMIEDERIQVAQPEEDLV